ncbi:MAG: TonB-dependent receptor, partial [Bacteroidales bacterium]|nr:TonB-dependent receptor [Bacteroidales bacterium]
MRKFSMAALLLLTFTLAGLSTLAQTISGKIIDAETEEPLIGATIKLEGTSQGAATDLDGNFSFEAPAGEQNLVISYVGYVKKTKTLTVSSGKNNLETIKLQPSAIGLQEIKVVSSYVKDRETPISVSTIEPEDIEEKMGSKQFPEMLETTPSVYATKRGGGYGDS